MSGNSKFKKFDDNKLRWHLLPVRAQQAILEVLEHGARKYGDYNWLEHADEVNFLRYSNALERHLAKWKLGQDIDEESKLAEIAHVATNAVMLLEYHCRGVGIDDRVKINSNVRTKK